MSITKRGYFTDLDGNPVTPVIVGDASDDEFAYCAILVTYDIPAPHIQHPHIVEACPESRKRQSVKRGNRTVKVSACDMCNRLCRQRLKSMRNELNYWLRQHGMKVSDSEYMLPSGSPEQVKRITEEFEQRFRVGFGTQYTEWGLHSVMNWYRIALTARGALTKAAMTLKSLHKSVQDILSSVEQGIRWHMNHEDATVFEENKSIFGEDEKSKVLHGGQVKAWMKKFESYEAVLDDFLNEDSATEAGLGTVDSVSSKLQNIARRIEQAAILAGVKE